MNISKQFISTLAVTFGVTFGVLAATGVLAWSGPSASAPGNNASAPINTSNTGQVKVGGLELNSGGASTGLIVHGNTTADTINANGSVNAVGSGSFSNGLSVSNANGAYTYITLHDDESPNGVKYIHANSNVVGFLNGQGGWITYWDNDGTLHNSGGAQLATNGDLYMPWKGQWLSTALGNKLDFNTWGPGSTYYGTNGDMYMPWAGTWLSTYLTSNYAHKSGGGYGWAAAGYCYLGNYFTGGCSCPWFAPYASIIHSANDRTGSWYQSYVCVSN